MADASSVVQMAPIVNDLSPWINALIQPLTYAVVAIIFGLIAKYTGVAFSPDFKAQIQSSADSLVQAAAAKVEGNLGTKAFDVGSPMVASMVSQLAANEPKIVSKLGLKPDDLAHEVLAAIGRYQQSFK